MFGIAVESSADDTIATHALLFLFCCSCRAQDRRVDELYIDKALADEESRPKRQMASAAEDADAGAANAKCDNEDNGVEDVLRTVQFIPACAVHSRVGQTQHACFALVQITAQRAALAVEAGLTLKVFDEAVPSYDCWEPSVAMILSPLKSTAPIAAPAATATTAVIGRQVDCSAAYVNAIESLICDAGSAGVTASQLLFAVDGYMPSVSELQQRVQRLVTALYRVHVEHRTCVTVTGEHGQLFVDAKLQSQFIFGEVSVTGVSLVPF